MDFAQVEAEFQKLKAQYESGALAEAQFKAELEKLMLQDERGRWWMIGYETGQWYYHDGQAWVRTEPPQVEARAEQAHGSGARPVTVPSRGALQWAVLLVAAAVFGATLYRYRWSTILALLKSSSGFNFFHWIALSGVFVVWPVIVSCLAPKAGAATLYAMLAGFVAMPPVGLFGAFSVVMSGLEGLGVDIGMALSKRKPALSRAMIGAGLGSLFAGQGLLFELGAWSISALLLYGMITFVSGAVLGGLVGWLIVKALCKTGAISRIGFKGCEKID